MLFQSWESLLTFVYRAKGVLDVHLLISELCGLFVTVLMLCSVVFVVATLAEKQNRLQEVESIKEDASANYVSYCIIFHSIALTGSHVYHACFSVSETGIHVLREKKSEWEVDH